MMRPAIALWVVSLASTASAARLAALVDAPAAQADALGAAVKKQLAAGGATLVDAAAPDRALDDGALTALRHTLDVARVVAVRVQRQGKRQFLVEVRAADGDGVAHRFAAADADTLVDTVVKTVAALPPPAVTATLASAGATPATAATTPAAATSAPSTTTPSTTPATTPPADASPPDAAPPPAAAEPAPLPAPASSATPPPAHRKREYGLLIGGIVAFFVPWIATMGLAGNYLSYNPNAARLGFIPIAGPFLARREINDKDLKDGYDVGLTVDGAVQIVGASLLVAGILYAAIGVPARESRAAARWRPLVAAGPGVAALGAEVRW